MLSEVRFNKYMPAVLLYFFFNGFLLPLGLLYTTLLTPLFLLWLFKFRSFRHLIWFFVFFIPFMVVQLHNGVDNASYTKSSFLLFSVYVFSLAFYQFLQNCQSLRRIYSQILTFNAVMVVLAIFALAIPLTRNIFWYANEITSGVHTLRLRLLTYEPSYYATLLMPLMLYYYLKLIVLRLPDPVTTFLLITIPFLLAFSFGGILGLVLALLLTLLYGYRRFFNKMATLYLLIGGVVLITGLLGALILFPNNVIVIRFTNVFNGTDTSFRGRTFESFSLGWQIAQVKSIWFGCGPGQAKEVGLAIFRKFYNYPRATKEMVVIPNSVADTLAALGILGVALRLVLQTVFFFRTRVYSNYYRLALFLFIFIYQFTGSFMTNIAEYVIWIMAFQKAIFPEFDKTRFALRLPVPRVGFSNTIPKPS
jgi:hypothetical protein